MKKRVVIILLAILVSSGTYLAFTRTSILSSHEVGDAIDSLNGVVVYYNGSVSHVNGRNLAPDGYNLGLKYQCVEFVKRYYYEHYNHKMPDSYGHAKDFFSERIADGAMNTRRDLLQFTNPSKSKPAVGDLIIMDGHSLNPYGHVVIVSGVFENEIEIIQQNPGPTAPSRDRINLTHINCKWKIEQEGILGFLRKK